MRKSKVNVALAPSNETLNEWIARKAYELYEQRGGDHGHDLDDWLAAERLIQAEAATGAGAAKAKGKVVSMRRKKVNG